MLWNKYHLYSCMQNQIMVSINLFYANAMKLIPSGVKSDYEPGFFCCCFDLLGMCQCPLYLLFFIKIMILSDLLNFCHVVAKSL